MDQDAPRLCWLIAEADPPQQVLRQAMERSGYRVVCYQQAESVPAPGQDGSPDLVLVAAAPGDQSQLAALAERLGDAPQIEPIADMERRAIEQAMRAFGGSVRRTSEALGISEATVYRKLRSYGLTDRQHRRRD